MYQLIVLKIIFVSDGEYELKPVAKQEGVHFTPSIRSFIVNGEPITTGITFRLGFINNCG